MKSGYSKFPSAISMEHWENGILDYDVQAKLGIDWINQQKSAPLIIVTPLSGDIKASDHLRNLVESKKAKHVNYRTLDSYSLNKQNVIHCWPEPKIAMEIWDLNLKPNAIVFIDPGSSKSESANQIEFSGFFRLWHNYENPELLTTDKEIILPAPCKGTTITESSSVFRILNEIGNYNKRDIGPIELNRLKSDMTQCKDRWKNVTQCDVESIGRRLKMSPFLIEKIKSILSRSHNGEYLGIARGYAKFRYPI